MPRHRRTVKHSQARLLNLFRLEERLTPAITIMGPHTSEELAILSRHHRDRLGTHRSTARALGRHNHLL